MDGAGVESLGVRPATYPARTRSILERAGWVRDEQIELVVMEASGEYWKPVFYLLEDELECLLLDARQVKHLPGRPKTDREDSIWLAKVAERGRAKPSFVPPKPVRQLRDLTRYRRSLTQDRTRNKQRLEKVLEDAQIKLSSVITDIHGVWSRDDRGRFTDHHAVIWRMMLTTIDALSTQIQQLSGRIEQAAEPFVRQVEQLDEITGVGRIAAQDIIADRCRHGRVRERRATRSFLGARCRRIVRRRGKKKALVAVGNSMLTIIWQLLPNPEEHYRDLGAAFYDTHLNQLGDHHKKGAESRTQPPTQLPRRCALAFCISASITVTDAPNGDDLGPCE